MLSVTHILLVLAYNYYWLRSKLVFLKIRLRKPALPAWQVPGLLLRHVDGSANLLLYLLLSLLALLNVKLYALHLIHFMLRFEVLESILFAIRANSRALSVVLLLTLMLGYNFAFAFFELYEMDVNKLEDYSNEKKCENVLDCFIHLFASGIIGVQTDSIIKFRFFADLTYTFLFQVLISNIIVALLIDRFAEQRNTRRVIETEV